MTYHLFYCQDGKLSFWKNAANVFRKGPSEAEQKLEEKTEYAEKLDQKVGQLTYEVDWLKKKDAQIRAFRNKKFKLIDKDDKHITVKRQCALLGVNRTSIYREAIPVVVSEEEIQLRNTIDHIHTDEPTWGYRKITHYLNLDVETEINHKKTLRIMRNIGIYGKKLNQF